MKDNSRSVASQVLGSRLAQSDVVRIPSGRGVDVTCAVPYRYFVSKRTGGDAGTDAILPNGAVDVDGYK